MRIVLVIFITLAFLGCGGAKPTTGMIAGPAWYLKQNVQAQTKYDTLGYGEGSTLKEAELNAKESIAQTLSSKVDSKMSLHSTDEFSRTKAEVKITSNVNLQNLKTLKKQHLNGTYYVAIKYENLDLAYRVEKSIGHINCENEKMNSYLQKTSLAKSVNSAVKCEIATKLQRRNSAWYLTYKEHMFLLNESEFEQLYISTNSTKYGFESSKKVLKDGDSFHFSFSSNETVYVTLLDVYANGVVTLLQDSTLVDGSLQIPSKESDSYFEAGLVKEGEDTHDLYVAIFTKEPIDMSRYEYANEELASSELAYKFDELLDSLDKYEYATILLRTKVK